MQAAIPAPMPPQIQQEQQQSSASILSQHALKPPLPASLTTKLHRPHLQEQQNFRTAPLKVGADFFVPRCFSVNKGPWLNHLELQQPLVISRGLVCFRVVVFCSM